MPVSDVDMIKAWKKVLTLSKLEPGQMVTVLTSMNSHPQSINTAVIGVQELGGTLCRIDLEPINGDKALSRDPLAYTGTTPLTGNNAALAALKESDLVLDLMTLLFSPEQHEVLQAGTKILLAVEPPEILLRMVPTEADRARVNAGAALLERAKQLKVESSSGTSLNCSLGEYPVIKEYGFVDEPGRWDHWPSGFVFSWPNEGSSNGTVVLDRGDILLPMKCYIANPITLQIKNGFVTSIDGGLDADLLRDYIVSFEDPEAYAVSHIGWGLQRRARWSTLGLYDREATIGMDARAFDGNFLFSLGPNNEVGGSRLTACHIDIPMRNCTVELDGTPVVRGGEVVNSLLPA
jgi:2,5-dihydroxypyridine 5,6-dioxygenase